jgi:hypothetical protein
MIQQYNYWLYTQRIKVTLLKRHLITHVYHNNIHSRQIMESVLVPINGWIVKESGVYKHNVVLVSH